MLEAVLARALLANMLANLCACSVFLAWSWACVGYEKQDETIGLAVGRGKVGGLVQNQQPILGAV